MQKGWVQTRGPEPASPTRRPWVRIVYTVFLCSLVTQSGVQGWVECRECVTPGWWMGKVVCWSSVWRRRRSVGGRGWRRWRAVVSSIVSGWHWVRWSTSELRMPGVVPRWVGREGEPVAGPLEKPVWDGPGGEEVVGERGEGYRGGREKSRCVYRRRGRGERGGWCMHKGR